MYLRESEVSLIKTVCYAVAHGAGVARSACLALTCIVLLFYAMAMFIVYGYSLLVLYISASSCCLTTGTGEIVPPNNWVGDYPPIFRKCHCKKTQ